MGEQERQGNEGSCMKARKCEDGKKGEESESWNAQDMRRRRGRGRKGRERKERRKVAQAEVVSGRMGSRRSQRNVKFAGNVFHVAVSSCRHLRGRHNKQK
jgi:hypothetical protein